MTTRKKSHPSKLEAQSELFTHSFEKPHPKPLPLVAIIGRPNVGKSTLFNRIVGQRKAIVDDVPGVTRDRNVAECDYQGHVFQLMDTGGLDPSASEGMVAQIKHQSELAIREGDILIFLMDGRAGLTPMDEEIALLLRGMKKPVFLSVNKIDTPKSDPLLADFFQLGHSDIFPLSPANPGLESMNCSKPSFRICPKCLMRNRSNIPGWLLLGGPTWGNRR